MNRVTPWIRELADNEIFVFGSNTSGRHGKGAAKQAMRWGAKYGQATGLQGRTYGIPTVNAGITNKLSLSKIQGFVDDFIDFAVHHPSLTFLVTEIGCGLAGWDVKDIAPMFAKAKDINNIWLPSSFWKILKE